MANIGLNTLIIGVLLLGILFCFRMVARLWPEINWVNHFRIADPGLWPVSLEPFTSKDTARARWRCFDPSHAPAPELLRGDSLPCATAKPVDGNDGDADSTRFHHAAGTTAFMVADADGNVVAVTQTLGTWGGNF